MTVNEFERNLVEQQTRFLQQGHDDTAVIFTAVKIPIPE
jgi:hypothetical protein